MDFQLFFVAFPDVARSLELSNHDLGVMALISLMTSALGGWIAGVAADRYGRLPVLQWAVVLYSFGSLATAFSDSMFGLLFSRSIAGFGFGAEWTAGAVLLSEWARREARGRLTGYMLSGWGVGWLLAGLVYYGSSLAFTSSWVWRIPFLVGAAGGIVVLLVRLLARESSIFVSQAQQNKLPSSQVTVGRIALFVVLATSVQGTYYALHVFLPSYFRSFQSSTSGSTSILLIFAAVGSIAGSVVGALLVDAVGRRRLLVATGVSLAALVWAVIGQGVLSAGPAFSLAAGFIPSLGYAALTPLLNEAFDSGHRASLVGLTYNAGRAFAGLYPYALGILTPSVGLAAAVLWVVSISCSILVIISYFVVETKGVDLTNVGMTGATDSR
ncbi:MFS family permease [Rhizobium alvei]